MSVPLKFAAGDSCLVKGERGRIHRIIDGLAAVQIGDAIRDVPVAELDIALPKLGPTVRRGKSKQNYGTPPAFIRAVEKRFGKIVCDLAASASNSKAERFFNEEADSLKQPWADAFPTGLLYCNPPFSNIEPWAAKCSTESARRHGLIALLTPASIGTDWFACHVNRQAMVLGLRPRLVFEGEENGYPKDLQLAVYGFGLHGFDTWRWGA